MDEARAHAGATYAFTVAFFDQLARSGVRHVLASPGSRSTPLVLAADAIARQPARAAADGALEVRMHLDERAAGFFALGMAKALGAPVALVCTSGTAAANYLPAVVEAFHAGVALLVLTADRPPELRDRGAGQTIDQHGLYTSAVRWFHELPVPGSAGPPPRHARAVAARALAEALGPPAGPVHLDWPLREPLAPADAPIDAAGVLRAEAAAAGREAGRGPRPAPRPPGGRAPRRGADAHAVHSLARAIAQCERAVVLCGPDELGGSGQPDDAHVPGGVGPPGPPDPLDERHLPGDRDGADAFGASGDRGQGPGPHEPGQAGASGGGGGRGDPRGDTAAAAVARLAHVAGWPLLAEPGSGLRSDAFAKVAPVVAHADLLLRSERFARAQRPDFVLRIGRAPTSRAQRLWLEAHPPADYVLVDPDRAWHDPGALATERFEVDPAWLCDATLQALGPVRDAPRAGRWLEGWLEADAAADAAIRHGCAASGALCAARGLRELAALLPDDAWLYVSNSMAVRDMDAFWPRTGAARRVLSSRGASGIDGVTSAALGAAAASGRRVVLWTGDLALLHDMGGLLAARHERLCATLVVVDDAGGGIFSTLPVARHGEAVAFERWFRTPQGLDLAALAPLGGAHFARADSWKSFRRALAGSFARDGVSLVVLPVDADANHAARRTLEQAVVHAVEAGLPASAPGGRKGRT